MKTLIIYTEVPDTLPSFKIIEGDYSRFDNIYINMDDEHPFYKECLDFLFDNRGNCRHEFLEDVSIVESKDFDKVVRINFYM
jgi:hypothetical protein